MTLSLDRVGRCVLASTPSFSGRSNDAKVEAFLNVRNLLNRDPEIVPQGPTDFTYVYPLSKGVSGFDLLDRQFLLGADQDVGLRERAAARTLSAGKWR
jgi:hypothetical protein